VNVLARCANEKRYLQVAVQATGNYVVAAVPYCPGHRTLQAWQRDVEARPSGSAAAADNA
jgi:flagella basal body P-ring formation protein FlgA